MPFSARSSAIRSQTEPRAIGSRPIVGSSRMSRRGRLTSACASSSRRTIPPEYVDDQAVGVLEHAGRGQRPLDPLAALAPRHVEQAREQHHVLAPGERGLRGELLRHVADELAHAHPLARHVAAEDVRHAGRHAQQRRQHADRRGLAGAVGSEQAEHLAGPNAQVDVVDRAVRPEP